ncbi:aminotransferase class IV family protein [Mesorhizobium sp. LHD-90]|uniref:aminotransferase class IV family protein n=1 Tax=Mesorhizobium sp. LHD-90 TaxID=3071414 RepID=UPI0027DF7D5B|nr:aminotransferase class IV family protein [Mesorhizobium sp. LHD-90]MDQ6433674.1 aminotransferase class IV family protein [Mesorhizobium sp. LHD-90]
MPSEGPLRDGNGPGFELIETLRWEPEGGFVRLERHLARLYASAIALGFPADPQKIGEALHECEGERVPLRVRLALAGDGSVSGVTQPFEPLPENSVWTLRIAGTRIDSADPLLRHKTTRRALYETARAEFPRDQADEMLLLNERGEICEGTITNIFLGAGDGGPMLTPALSCGLLPGVLRDEMLDDGKAREAVLILHDLWTAQRIYVGNSLRGLIEARISAAPAAGFGTR